MKRLNYFILTLCIVFLCIALSPVLATPPAVKPAQTSSLMQQGQRLYETGRFAEAVNVLKQSASDFKATGDRLNEVISLSNLSLAYQQLGQWPEAGQAIAQSLKLLQTEQNLGSFQERSQILAQTLDVQGRLQLAQGKAEIALLTWQKAADIYVHLNDEVALTRNRINQAQAMQALGLYLQANKTLTQVQEILNKQSDSPLKTIGLRSLGNVLRVVGDLSESRKVLEQSLAVAQRVQATVAQSDALLSLGNTAYAKLDTQEAIKFYQQAATSASATPTTRIQAQLNILRLLQEKDLSENKALLSQIQSQIAELPPSRMAVYARINLAQSLMKLGNREWGIGNGALLTTPYTLNPIPQILATAVKHAQSLQDKRAESYALGTLGEVYEKTGQLSDAQNLTQQALIIASGIDAQDVTYQWQWQLGRLLRAKGDIKASIAAYEQAYNTLKSLRSDLVAINPDVQFSFRESVEPVYRELVDLLLQTGGKIQPPLDNLKQARYVLESLQLAELDNFFRSACLQPKVELDKIVEQNKSTAVIYPIILDKRLEIIVKLPGLDEFRSYTTQKTKEQVESSVAQLRQYLNDVAGTSQVRQQSQQFYDWLIRPAEAELTKNGIKTLVFVLDGSLRNIPMGVLYDKQQKKYLVEKYAISLTPGLQLFDPKPLRRIQLKALIAGVDEERSIEGREFASLPNVAEELKEIQSKMPRSQELLNKKFTKENLQNQIKSVPFSVVHLATHGQFSSNPEETFILTWDKLLKVKDFDDLVRVSDSTRRFNTIELLVLSACKTALGDNRAALGLAGVAVRAGARSTLATLWSVDDRSTSKLMSEFYRELKTGVTKAEALQHAQLAVFAQEKRPFFWAPYVLVGNWL